MSITTMFAEVRPVHMPTVLTEEWKDETVYVAGPMRGYDLWNFPAFDEARDDLLTQGFMVISPADMDRDRGFTENDQIEDPDEWAVFYAHAMRIDTLAIVQADAIYLLRGWDKSTGARYEHILAKTMGKKIMYQPGALHLDVDIIVNPSLSVVQ